MLGVAKPSRFVIFQKTILHGFPSLTPDTSMSANTQGICKPSVYEDGELFRSLGRKAELEGLFGTHRLGDPKPTTESNDLVRLRSWQEGYFELNAVPSNGAGSGLKSFCPIFDA